MNRISLKHLGQSGCRLEYAGTVLYVDPYLSNSVQELDAPDLKRLIPIPIQPKDVVDADWVLITHDHIDHCDPHTLPCIAKSSLNCRFIGPPTVLENLLEWDIAQHRLHLSEEQWVTLNPTIKIRAVPASHPTIERDTDGNILCVGYLLEIKGKRIYLAGDTNVSQELINTLKSLTPIATAFLPVNEHNFFRGRRGIIGNMSVRDAFQLAEEIGVETMIPVHWDMFEINSVEMDEIRAVYRRSRPAFDLQIQPTSIAL